jgi:hypothetical protein
MAGGAVLSAERVCRAADVDTVDHGGVHEGDEIEPFVVGVDVVGEDVRDARQARHVSGLDFIVERGHRLAHGSQLHRWARAVQIDCIDDALPTAVVLVESWTPSHVVLLVVCTSGGGAAVEAVPSFVEIRLRTGLGGDEIVEQASVLVRVVPGGVVDQWKRFGEHEDVIVALREHAARVDLRRCRGVVPVPDERRADADLRVP